AAGIPRRSPDGPHRIAARAPRLDRFLEHGAEHDDAAVRAGEMLLRAVADHSLTLLSRPVLLLGGQTPPAIVHALVHAPLANLHGLRLDAAPAVRGGIEPNPERGRHRVVGGHAQAEVMVWLGADPSDADAGVRGEDE